MDVPAWKKSQLLSLPKELRLEVWKWTLTDPSVPELAVHIGRDKAEHYSKGTVPRVTTWLQPGWNCPIGLDVLRTNRFIYEEALPLLYKSVRFAPAGHQGIFPLFLDSLSPYAQSLIRHVRLHVPRQIHDKELFGDPAVALFHWAVTCAQVAKLDGQLRDVEVEGLWAHTGSLNVRSRRSILYPLCKIKTHKLFGSSNDSGVEQLLEAERELKTRVALRMDKARQEAKRKTEMEAEWNAKLDAKLDAERDPRSEAKRDAERKAVVKELIVQQLELEDREKEWHATKNTLRDLHEQNHSTTPNAGPSDRTITHDCTINHDLSEMPGIDVFEKELDEHTSTADNGEGSSTYDAQPLLEDWDVVSYRSGASMPRGRPPSYMSRRSSDSWTDAESTIAEMETLMKEEEEGK